MISTLHKIFLESAIKNIDVKYQQQLQLNDEKLLIYSNIFNLPLYYKVASFKKNPDYNLYNKFQHSQIIETIYIIIDKILENDYDNDLILLLYSYISNIYLNKTLDNYINNFLSDKILLSKKKAMNLRSKIASSIQSYIYFEKEQTNINKYKPVLNNLKLPEKTSDVLNQISVKLHYFSYGKDVLEIGLKNFIKYKKQKQGFFTGIHMIAGKLLDAITRSKKYSIYSIYHNYKIDEKYLTTNDLDFISLYNQTLQEVSNIISLVSEEIYYKKKNKKIIIKILKNNE